MRRLRAIFWRAMMWRFRFRRPLDPDGPVSDGGEEPCQTCGGSGGQYEQTHATLGGEWWESCPECDGGEDRP